jgi:predicted metal-dependent phosphoesterase TrpH
VDFVDLHLHTSHSDGSDTPEQVVARAVAAGAVAMAITDHDTLAGVAAGRKCARDGGIDFLSGTEISAYFQGREVHVLAYGVDERDPDLLDGLATLCASRRARSGAIVERLQALGMDLEGQLDDVAAAGRMHIARAMTAAGYVKKPQEAFDRYLNPGKGAFVPKWAMPLAEAIERIHGAGGLAFLAHPGLGKTVRKQLPKLLRLPFDGIEAYHISHTAGRVAEFEALAREHGLLVSGGSDCHGTIKGPALLGRVQTPVAVYDAIQDRLAART